jgi:hypothetical protein
MLEAAQKAEAAAASPTPLRTFIDEVEDWERTAMLKNKDAGSKFKLIAKYKDVYLHIDAEDDDEGEDDDDDDDDDDSGPMDFRIHGLLWVKKSKKKDEILGAPIVKRGYRLDAYVLRTVYYFVSVRDP